MAGELRPFRGEGWRCFRCGTVYALGTPQCAPCAADTNRRVAELRSLRTGLPPRLTTFGVGVTDDPHPGVDAGAGAAQVPSRVSRLVALLRAGHQLTGPSVAEQLGCSERTGRRLLAEAHQIVNDSPA